jgi:predicted acylesterase/phospholipase RssA
MTADGDASKANIREVAEVNESAATIGIALSGGGIRAALYSLGVLVYLVHSGLHERVRLISSVSGGSIVNAILGLSNDYSRMSREEFNTLAGRLASQLAKQGVFFWPGLGRFLLWLFPLLLWSPGMLLVLQLPWDWRLFWLGELLYALPVGLYGITIGRQRAQDRVYAAFVAKATTGQKRSPKSARKAQLTDFAESRVRHVLCATELTSGRPFYMDRQMVHSPAYGSGLPKLSVSKAIYASAAFPVGFPPLRVKTADLNMSGGDTEDRPARLILSDGGVFNNLGTDLFTAWEKVAASPFTPDARFTPLPNVEQRIIVNASSPATVMTMPRIWIWRNILAIPRIMSILYENTVRPRVERLIQEEATLGGPLVIDISDSPIELADRIKRCDNGDGASERAAEMSAQLDSFRDDAYWHGYTNRASLTKTVLRAVGETVAVRLLILGYLNATIACHARLKSAGLNEIPSEYWFQTLVRADASSVGAGTKKAGQPPLSACNDA